MIIDTHCHFDMIPNPEQYIQSAENKGNIIIGMTNLPSHFEMGYTHVRNFRHIRLALGFHPQLAAKSSHELVSFGKQVNKTSYIGEVGLDFSKDFVDSKEKQIYAFRYALNQIKDKNKIVSVHSRKAEKEVFELLQEYEIKNVIFHWYSGPLNLIDKIIDAGYYFSINEAMTVSISGRKIINKIPQNRILTESDAPFNKHSNILNAISNIGLTEDLIYLNFLNLINAIV